MAVVTKEVLKSYFNDGDVPMESNYIDLIDSLGNYDMAKSVYDTNDDGKVNSADYADNADTVDNQHASEFAPSGFGLGTEALDVSDGDWNSVLTTGFYRGDNMNNAPSASNQWFYVWALRHSDTYIQQYAAYYYSDQLWTRRKQAGTWYSWQPVYPPEWAALSGRPSTFPPSSHTHGGGDITSQVDDANKVDGLHAASFVRADADDTKTGDLRMTGGLTVGATADYANNGQICATGSYRTYRGTTNHIMHIPILLDTPRTFSSSKFNGTGQSDTSRTFIDMSTELSGVPTAYIIAYKLMIATRDAASFANDVWMMVGPLNVTDNGVWCGCSGNGNDKWVRQVVDCKANSNGDLYYQIQASGSGTFDMVWKVLGYFID